MLSEYCNQDIVLKIKTGVDKYNKATYATSTIKGRLRSHKKLIKKPSGEEIYSGSKITTKSDVNLDDVITHDSTDYNVLEVKKLLDIDSELVGYEVFI
jgi:hypothetical protein